MQSVPRMNGEELVRIGGDLCDSHRLSFSAIGTNLSEHTTSRYERSARNFYFFIGCSPCRKPHSSLLTLTQCLCHEGNSAISFRNVFLPTKVEKSYDNRVLA
jgi:hypothetical protein